jgi:hypothetical protein
MEMFPDGKVGVDEVCVLGLNVNKGQEIRLRLRTDDLRGFRTYATVKKVRFLGIALMIDFEIHAVELICRTIIPPPPQLSRY